MSSMIVGFGAVVLFLFLFYPLLFKFFAILYLLFFKDIYHNWLDLLVAQDKYMPENPSAIEV